MNRFWFSSIFATVMVLVLLICSAVDTGRSQIIIPPASREGPYIDGTNFIWRAYVSSNDYGLPLCLVTSTNSALAMTNWSRLMTNYVDVQGYITFTNPITAGRPAQFFRAAIAL